MNLFNLTSDTWRSCEFTRKASGQTQVLFGTMLSPEDRKLRATIILEEALETIEGLGFEVAQHGDGRLKLLDTLQPDMEKIIDGCCD